MPTAREIMTPDAAYCPLDSTALDAARQMADNDIGAVPVCDRDGRLVGVVTDRDLALRVLAESKRPCTPVSEVMSRHVVTCRLDDDLQLAEGKMASYRKSRIVILDERGGCAGVLSISDVAGLETRRRTGWLLREVVRRETRPRLADKPPAGFL